MGSVRSGVRAVGSFVGVVRWGPHLDVFQCKI